MHNQSPVFSRIYTVVSQIPKGKVATYKMIATLCGIRDIRLVGFALHLNRDPVTVPCHRVVRSDGTLAKGYAMGGMTVQKKLLMSEGIIFSQKGIIKLAEFFWKG